MSVLDAFFLNWRDARETFGEGAPQTGEQFDHSAQFRELETQLESVSSFLCKSLVWFPVDRRCYRYGSMRSG